MNSSDKGQRPDSQTVIGKLVLVVEDDNDVRELVSNILEILDYRSIAVANALEAKEILVQDKIDILLTDMVLPGGVNGRQLAEVAKNGNPDLRVLYMSGYPAKAGKDRIPIPEDGHFLSKPFQTQQLADALNRLIAD
jgi:CheY-like chemotaxis protein